MVHRSLQAIACTLLAGSLGICQAAFASDENKEAVRTWTLADGRQAELAFLRLEQDQVVVRSKDERERAIPLTSFSDEDQTWIRDAAIEQELAKLQGQWRLAAAAARGQVRVAPVPLRMQIEGDQVTRWGSRQGKVERATIRLTLGAEHNSFELDVEGLETKLVGLYRATGQTIYLCWRPDNKLAESFVTSRQNRTIVHTYQRVTEEQVQAVPAAEQP